MQWPQMEAINYTNPEAKLVEAISKLTTIRVVGLCHGLDGGINQLSEFLEIPREYIGMEGGGLNHFGFFTKIWDKRTGEDLYPCFKEKEEKANRLALFEHVGLARTKLLQAILLDPQAPTYYQACAMIDKMCELQKDILPKLEWK